MQDAYRDCFPMHTMRNMSQLRRNAGHLLTVTWNFFVTNHEAINEVDQLKRRLCHPTAKLWLQFLGHQRHYHYGLWKTEERYPVPIISTSLHISEVDVSTWKASLLRIFNYASDIVCFVKVLDHHMSVQNTNKAFSVQ